MKIVNIIQDYGSLSDFLTEFKIVQVSQFFLLHSVGDNFSKPAPSFTITPFPVRVNVGFFLKGKSFFHFIGLRGF